MATVIPDKMEWIILSFNGKDQLSMKFKIITSAKKIRLIVVQTMTNFLICFSNGVFSFEIEFRALPIFPYSVLTPTAVILMIALPLVTSHPA